MENCTYFSWERERNMQWESWKWEITIMGWYDWIIKDFKRKGMSKDWKYIRRTRQKCQWSCVRSIHWRNNSPLGKYRKAYDAKKVVSTYVQGETCENIACEKYTASSRNKNSNCTSARRLNGWKFAIRGALRHSAEARGDDERKRGINGKPELGGQQDVIIGMNMPRGNMCELTRLWQRSSTSLGGGGRGSPCWS